MPSDDDFVRFQEQVELHNGLNPRSKLPETVSSYRQLNPYESAVAFSRQHSNDKMPRQGSGEGVPVHFGRWLWGQRQAVAYEEATDSYAERMAQDYPGDENEPMRNRIRIGRFNDFAMRSQYSPILLAERMPRQPRPSDIHDDMDPRLFTYVDAFEDLLAEAAGQPTMDLRARYDMNKMLRRTWPFGESPVSWAKRLEAQGLVRAFVPDYRGLPAPTKPYRWQVERVSEEEPVAAAAKETWQDGSTDKEPAEDGLFGEIEKAVKFLNQMLDETTAINSAFWDKDRSRGRQEPGTERDLYDAVQSAFSEGQRSLAAFFKSLAEGIEPRAPPRTAGAKSETDVPAAAVEDDVRNEEEDGMQTVRSTREYVDEYGNKHVRTEVKRTNREGTVVSTETRYSVRPASEAERATVEGLPAQPREEQRDNEGGSESHHDEHEGDKKPGWFWK